MTLWTILAGLAVRQAGTPAILAPQRLPLNFGELPSRLEAVRSTLNRYGIGRGDLVAMALPDGAETGLCLLGVMSCAIAAPLNPNYSEAEFGRYLARLRPKALIVQQDCSDAAIRQARILQIPMIELIPGSAGPSISFELRSDLKGSAQKAEWNGGDDHTVVLHTSGSTSQPKLVPYRIRRLVAYTKDIMGKYGVGPSDRSIQVMPLFHGHGITSNLVAPLLAGSGVVCPGAFDVAKFFACIQEFEPTWYSAGYAFHHAILDQIGPYRDVARAARLRFIRSGAGRLEPHTMKELEAIFGAPVSERYSSTETGVLTSNPLPPGIRKPGTVGVPTINEVRIIDSRGAFLGPNQEGEIVARGPTVFDGYWDDPEATEAAFVDGWFRTGDLGWFDDDGYLTLSGRVKDVINRGGEKVSPAEVESVLLRNEAVAEVCVFPVAHPSLGQELCAAVVPRLSGDLDEAKLLVHARKHLAPFKVPRKIFVRDSLPKTATGKLQRTTMANILGVAVDDVQEQRANLPEGRPTSALEAALAGLWSSVLGQKNVPIERDYFLLGGDSFSAVVLLAQVQEAFGVCLPFALIFDEASTVAKMAQCIEASRKRGVGLKEPDAHAGDDAAAIPRRDTSLPCPLSSQQRRLWFIERLHPGNWTYNVTSAIRLKESPDIGALRKAINSVVARHEALRTTFAILDGEPSQVIAPHLELPLPIQDLRDLPPARKEAEALRIRTEEARRPFDLERGPLVRVLLIRLTSSESCLVLVQHHITTDAWSRGIFEHELHTLYEAFAAGRESPLPELERHYPDYAAWQQHHLSGKRLEELLDYWRGRLEGAPPAVAIPADHRHSGLGDLTGSLVERAVPKSLVRAFLELARKERTSAYVAGLAAFNVLLHRYSGEDDIVVGVPVQGRERAETLGIIGFFVNMLPIRCDLSGNPTFRELLGRVRKCATADFAHQHLPFERMVEVLQPDRRLGETPLFNTSFVLLDDRNRINREEWHVDIKGLDTGTAPFDLCVILNETIDGARLMFRYNDALFERATIERMLSHFVRLLEGIVENPDGRISAIPLLSPDERYHVVTKWNQTDADFPRDASLQALFQAQVDASPSAVAVCDGRRRLTYAQLDDQANQLAHLLRKKGAGPNTIVSICFERSIDLIVAILAVVKAGAAYLPLDPKLPEKRMNFIIADANAGFVITRSALWSAKQTANVTVIDLDTVASDIAGSPAERPSCQTTGGDLAYIIYTSGSTGQPKGVAVLQRGVTRLVVKTNYLNFSSDLVIAQVSNVAFDATTFEIWGTLLCGGRLEIFDEETVLRPDRLAEALAGRGITAMFLTAALFHQIAQLKPDAFKGLEALLVGGDTVDPGACRSVLDAGSPKRLINVYGPTEATTFASFHEIGPTFDAERSIPIGRPIANTRLYVLATDNQPVPVGVPGELHIGGPGVARGYFNLPELTSKRFILDPFSDQPGALLYKTGDRARFLSDGSVELIGRLDRQIKIRGFRVEPAEIESTLLRHPQIAEAAVARTDDQCGTRHLVAYLVKEALSAPSSSDLRAFLLSTLPGYMIPDSFVWLDRLPLTASGKLNRSALSCTPLVEERKVTAPRTAVERTVADIWLKHLGLPSIGVEEDFFQLGGHSLLAVNVMSALEQRFQVKLPLTLLFEAPTVASISKAIEARHVAKRPTRVITIQASGRKTPIYAIPAGGGGSVLGYGMLSRGLGSDHPFYGFEHPGLDDGHMPPERIESAAALFLEDIVHHGSVDQPCILLGACSGAVVAFELARLLRARERRVERVIMLDPSPIESRRRHRAPLKVWRQLVPARFIVRRLASYVKTFCALRGGRRGTFVKEKMGVFLSVVRQRSLFRDSIRELNQIRVREATLSALVKYTPRPYDGAVTLILGERRNAVSNRASFWKKACTGPFNVLRVKGATTGEMLKPPIVETLIAQLKKLLSLTADAPINHTEPLRAGSESGLSQDA